MYKYHTVNIKFDIDNMVMSMKSDKPLYELVELYVPMNGQFYDVTILGWEDPSMLREYSQQKHGFVILHEEDGYIALRSFKNQVAVIKKDDFNSLPFYVSSHGSKLVVGRNLPDNEYDMVYTLLESLSQSYNTVTLKTLEATINKLKLNKFKDYILSVYARSIY